MALLHNDALPFHHGKGIPVAKVLTDNGREFRSTAAHPFELYLSLSDIRHKRTKVRSPRTNGFVERFHRTVLDEFFRQAFRTKLFLSVEEPQADLDAWLVYYNTERPPSGSACAAPGLPQHGQAPAGHGAGVPGPAGLA